MQTRARIVAALLCVASTGGAAAPSLAIPGHPPVIVHGAPDVAKSLLAAEMAFEARAETAGPAQAMREFMDPADGLSFTGGEPVRGADAIFQAHGGAKPGGKLTWVPAELYAAASGDLGATWGHFRFVPPAAGPNGAPMVVTGRYVTVWHKRDGQWKGLFDIGNPD